jgi:hypothetical protein
MRARPALAAFILAAGAAAGCGTTVPATQQPAAAGNGLGAAAVPSGAASPAPATTESSAGLQGGAVTGTTTGGQAAPTGGLISGAPGSVSTTSSGLAPVEVGIGVDGNNSTFAAAFGVSQSQPDEQRIAAAVVADINRTGGLAGHPIAPVYAVFDNTSNDWVAQDEAICAAFTQDHHVAVAVRTDDIFGPLDACLAKARVPLVLWESVFRESSWHAAAPGLRYTPDEATGPRTYEALVSRMAATKRWGAATRIGLVRYDRPDQADIERDGVRPALARHGLKLADAAAVHTPASFSDLGSTSSEVANVILKFRQEGITDVVFMGGDVSFLFANAAESQQYRPRYALTSFDFPNLMPVAQLHGAFGIGWHPTVDLTSRRAPTPGTKRCDRALSGTGAVPDGTGSERLYVTCDHLYFLQAVYAAAGAVGPGAFSRGVARLGAGFAPAFTFAVDAARRPDGLMAFRDVRFDEGCSCLLYGGQFPMP